MMNCDFETRSTADLPEVGLYRYATHPTTDVMCMAFAFDAEDVQLIVRSDPLPARVREYVLAGGDVSARNAAFEYAIWNFVCVPRYGWPELKLEQLHCSQASSLAVALPAGLGACARALNLPEQKDEAGKRVMLQLSRPRAYG